MQIAQACPGKMKGQDALPAKVIVALRRIGQIQIIKIAQVFYCLRIVRPHAAQIQECEVRTVCKRRDIRHGVVIDPNRSQPVHA